MSIENPLESIKQAIVFSSKDYSACKRDAWLYGIVIGWDEDAMLNVAERHKWTPETVARLKRLHEAYLVLKSS